MNNEFLNLLELYKHTPYGIFQTTVSGKLEDCNNHLVDILGYDSVQEMKDALSSVFSQVILSSTEKEDIVNEIISRKEICIYEVKLRKKDKTIIDVKLSVKTNNENPSGELYLVGLMEDITEQKEKEEKSKLDELRYRDLFENSSDAIFIVRERSILQLNKRARVLFELPKDVEEIDTFTLFPEKQPDGSISIEKARVYINETLNGNPQKFEWQFKTYKKKKIYCEVSLSKFSLIADGSYHVIVHDISDKVLTEQRLTDSKEQYRLLVDTAPIGILRTGLDGKILFLNKKLAEIGGFKKQEEFLSHFQNMKDIYKYKEDRDRIITQLAQGKIVDTQLDVKGIDNTTLTVNIISSPVLNGNGKVDHVVTIVEDITDSIKLKHQVKERDEMLLSVVDSFPFELNVTNAAGKVIVQNDFSKKIFGDHVGENFMELLNSKEAKSRWTKDSNEIAKGKILDYEVPVEVNGKIYQLRRIKTPIKANGKISGIINMSIDITDRVQLQKEIEQHRDNLEYIVKSRTKEIRNLNDKLRSANDELSAANDFLTKQKKELEDLINELKQTQEQLIQSEKMASVGVLTAGIAHEINNPINFISSGLTGLEIIISDILEALNEYSLSHCNINNDCVWKQKFDDIDKAHRIVESRVNLPKLISTMRNGVLRTTEIVKGLRTFSRLDVEHMLQSNINELIDSSLIILKNKYKGRVEIIKEYTVFEPVNCFPGKLSQVFLNLIMNSIQAIENKGQIEIMTRKIEKSNSLEVRIKDDGKGIPPEILGKVFDPFFTTKAVGEGTGLGLSIVHSIISEHNGNIEVFSQINKGTEFRITLPIGI